MHRVLTNKIFSGKKLGRYIYRIYAPPLTVSRTSGTLCLPIGKGAVSNTGVKLVSKEIA
jgi:hypothetical protein